MALGVETIQRLEGSYHLLRDPGRERPLRLELEVRIPLSAAQVFDPKALLSGTIHAEGAAEAAAITGTLSLRRAPDPRLVYDLRFLADDGRERRLHAELELDLARPLDSVTSLVARVYDEEGEIARAVLGAGLGAGLRTILSGLRVR
ncbi:MAG: hypothetical protein OEY14_08920 [Myxococcales bacterium]|nr:hypothetical protein [Myxococcales bacterium]